jgi:hypothetical protein
VRKAGNDVRQIRHDLDMDAKRLEHPQDLLLAAHRRGRDREQHALDVVISDRPWRTCPVLASRTSNLAVLRRKCAFAANIHALKSSIPRHLFTDFVILLRLSGLRK